MILARFILRNQIFKHRDTSLQNFFIVRAFCLKKHEIVLPEHVYKDVLNTGIYKNYSHGKDFRQVRKVK